MAYRASSSRRGIEDELNVLASRNARDRSPKRSRRRPPGHEASAGEGSRQSDRSENRSRSPDRSSPTSGSSRKMSDLEKRRRDADAERELRAKEAREWNKDMSESIGEWRQPEFQLKEANDRQWDRFQVDIHDRIGSYAHEFIRDNWENGDQISRENYPRFAAEVLLYVRNRFYTEVAKAQATARDAGYEPERDPPNGHFSQKLILENMRWVCDAKIRPLTDQYSKDIFLCNGCKNKGQLSTLESVLQHYAAKHTKTLSRGNVAVHWRAEWPEQPLFNPEPDAVMNTSHSFAPTSTVSGNGPFTSPQGLGGYSESKELEKKKREQEIREREIQIKEVKEEIERKEREKMSKRETELRERQAQLAEAAERRKIELKDQASAPDKSLSDSQRGGGSVSSVQQNSASTFQDLTKPQINCDVATEYPERSSLPRIQNSDPKTRARSPSVRSVEMTIMDSNAPDSRTTRRLHLTGLFAQFMSEVSQQTALQLRRDATKKVLEQKTAAHYKARIMQKEFPSAEESTRASKERAQKEFDMVEKELIRKREASKKLSEEISEVVYPEEEPKDSEREVAGKIKNLEDKLAQYQADSELVKNVQQQQSQLHKTFMTENDKQVIVESTRNGFSSVRQEISSYLARISSIEADLAQLKQDQAPTNLQRSFEELTLRISDLEQRKSSESTEGLKSMVDNLSSRLVELQRMRRDEAELRSPNFDKDFADLRDTMVKVSSRIDGFEMERFELSMAVESIKNSLAVQSAAINDRSEMQNVHSSLQALSRGEGEMRAGFVKLQSLMQTLGKDIRATKMVERGHRSSNASVRDSSGISNDLRMAIHDEIKAQQEAVDLVLDEKFGNIEEQLGDLKTQLKLFERHIGETNGSLSSFRNQYTAQIDRIALDFVSVRTELNSTREEINALKQNDVHSLQLAYNSLDYRMNNLSTEHLARQILGQLDAHLRGGEKNIATLDLRLQELERRATKGEESTMARLDIEEGLRRARKELIDGVDERLDKFKSFFTALNNNLVREQQQLRTEMDTSHSKWQNVQADFEASKLNIAEAMGSLRTEFDTLTSKAQNVEADLSASKTEFIEATKSLRTEVDSIGPTLQTVQDDLGATKNNCSDANAHLKAEIAKVTKTIFPEKRRIESPGPIKTNVHKRRRAKRSISDSDDDA